MSRRKNVGNTAVSGVSPKEDCEKDLGSLKTVGLKLNNKETRRLADLLNDAIAAEDKWDYLNITGYRHTDQVTVTYDRPVGR